MNSPFNSITEMANGWKHLPLPLLCEAVRADQDERFARGERPRAEDYFRTLPKLAGSQEDALVIIYGEIMNRAELGDTYLLEEYCERFPHWRRELQDILMLHDGLTGCRFNSTQVTTEKEVREPPVVPGYEQLEFVWMIVQNGCLLSGTTNIMMSVSSLSVSVILV